MAGHKLNEHEKFRICLERLLDVLSTFTLGSASRVRQRIPPSGPAVYPAVVSTWPYLFNPF